MRVIKVHHVMYCPGASQTGLEWVTLGALTPEETKNMSP